MTQLHEPFISPSFLRTAWAKDYEAFRDSVLEKELLERLANWAKRTDLKETSAEQAFVEQFFHRTWGYFGTGQSDAEGFTSYPKYPVAGAGQQGGTGEADLALGWFKRQGVAAVPQVLCEFKDVRSSLDAPQNRKGNRRSPVKQCLDYLFNARRGLFGNEAIIPSWGIATDMNEFRLYWFDRAPQQYLRFVISPDDPLFTRGLLDPTEDGRFDRFVFYKVFHSDVLLSASGKCPLEKLIARQWVKEREIENEFYEEYRALRDRLYKVLVAFNQDFPGTKGKLVRLTQRILDRCLFVLYCEDMGDALAFPHQLLRDFLQHYSRDEYYDPNGTEVWDRLRSLFRIMNTGGIFPPDKSIKCFNGGLFEDDAEIESVFIPNHVFCERGQGENEASLHSAKNTLLYLSGAYNYAPKGDASKSLGLYTLGRIFEQSITELEILEAEAEGRESLNKISKRKRDGVYYTPERIVEKIVQETLGVRLDDLKVECGWNGDLARNKKSLNTYWKKLQNLTGLDPACGSGAFLITALRILLDEYHAVFEQRRWFGRKGAKKRIRAVEDGQVIKDILARNLYGVDINPSSVEITKLALWLHTARPGEKLSALDTHIHDGNSLIDDTFYLKQDLLQYAEEERERINAFDWWNTFPEIKARGGFDVIVGNPPYVKFQNFRKVHADMAEYLREGRQGKPYYRSTQTQNFDLYVPFIEKAISLLADNGRMGFIAPNLWTVNEYGGNLRNLLSETRQLDRWVDFKSYQIFEEATIYTALQFFTAGPNEAIRISPAPDGDLTTVTWDNPDNLVPYEALSPDDTWLLLPSQERHLIEKLRGTCRRLDDRLTTEAIYQGLITSADHIYHLRRLGTNRYLCKPKGKENLPYEVEI